MDLAARFILAMAISFVSTPIISRIASKNGVVDQPGGRKVHQEPRPLLGGLSIFLACGITGLIYYADSTIFASLLMSGTILVALGIIDDTYDLKPLYKLGGQIAAVVLFVLLNSKNFGVFVSYLDRFHLPGFITLGLIAGWIVLMINAFNLIDGLDGLAIGTAIIMLGALVLITSIGGNLTYLGLLLIMLGACLGFFPYNFAPARIFLGDTGSMLLGFILAVMHLFTIAAPVDSALVLGSAFIFAYPALDVTYAIYRRLRNKGSLFKGDQGHIHHILLRLGLGMRRVVLLLYLGSAFFAALAVFLLSMEVNARLVALLGVATLAGVVYLFYRLARLSRPSTGGSSIPRRGVRQRSH